MVDPPTKLPLTSLFAKKSRDFFVWDLLYDHITNVPYQYETHTA
jgi:hypothetical protein